MQCECYSPSNNVTDLTLGKKNYSNASGNFSQKCRKIPAQGKDLN